MSVSLTYTHHQATGAPLVKTAQAIWAVAAQLRASVTRRDSAWSLDAAGRVEAATHMVVNDRPIRADWDFDHVVHDEDGKPVLGICETDPAAPGLALVSVNPAIVTHHPDLALSTLAHEVGHVVFDVPAALGQQARRYR